MLLWCGTGCLLVNVNWGCDEVCIQIRNVWTSNVFSRFEIRQIFFTSSRRIQISGLHDQLIIFAVVNLTFSEMLNVIVFVGCVNKSKFLNLGSSEHSFHYGKDVSMIGIAFLHFIWYAVKYMSELLTWSNLHSYSNVFVLWNSQSTNSNFSRLRHIPSVNVSNCLLICITKSVWS